MPLGTANGSISMNLLPRLIAVASCLLFATPASAAPAARAARRAAPAQVQLIPAERNIDFPAPADSNSPMYWNDLGELVLFTSLGVPVFSVGPDITRLTTVGEVGFDNQLDGGRWLESVLRAGDGTLYGYYHFEPSGVCAEIELTEPQIGAAVSDDDGQTWRDLGIVLTAPPGYRYCDSVNSYFAGGVGDFSAILDRQQRYVYFFYTTYAGEPGEQGVSVARLPWSERDRPVGAVHKFFDGLWQEPGLEGRTTSVFPASVLWQDSGTDSYWGPSLHWNTELQSYVMLLNHTIGSFFAQDGIYIAFASTLEDPSLWTWPEQIIQGGDWYPQVVGLEDNRGTDSVAGREAWLCVRGSCGYRIVFEPAGAEPQKRAGVVTKAPATREPVKAKQGPRGPRRRAPVRPRSSS